MNRHLIYTDNAATTRIADEVLAAMLPFLKENYGNASTVYSLGNASKEALDTARKQTADALGCSPAEIYFTACGTESDNWAIKMTARRCAKKDKKHLICSVYEHHAVLETMHRLTEEGFTVTLLQPTPDGLITPEAVKAALRPDTALVSVMYVNNEIGTINPIAEIGAVCREAGVAFHTDAVQAVGHLPIDVKAQNIDMLSLSGHKFYAPKGVGALYVRSGLRLDPFLNGGQQERGKRAGTENVASIVGMGKALEMACAEMPTQAARITALRDRLIDGLLSIPKTRLNGSREHRVCGNVNVSFEGIEGESLLLWLDMNGICASSGSACTSQSLDPSHVLLSIGLPHELAHGSLRFSLGRYNTEADVDRILAVLPEIVTKLRAMSPIWKG